MSGQGREFVTSSGNSMDLQSLQVNFNTLYMYVSFNMYVVFYGQISS